MKDNGTSIRTSMIYEKGRENGVESPRINTIRGEVEVSV